MKQSVCGWRYIYIYICVCVCVCVFGQTNQTKLTWTKLTYALSRKVLSLTKPKGRIYKTKTLGHYITVRALSWIFSMYFLLSDGVSLRLVKNAEIELAMKPLHPTSIRNTFVLQPFLIHCSRRSSYFSNLRWCDQSKCSSKGSVNSVTKTFLL